MYFCFNIAIVVSSTKEIMINRLALMEIILQEKIICAKQIHSILLISNRNETSECKTLLTSLCGLHYEELITLYYVISGNTTAHITNALAFLYVDMRQQPYKLIDSSPKGHFPPFPFTQN